MELMTARTASASALLLSNDLGAVTLLRESLNDLAISICLCANAEDAIRLIQKRKFEAVIVDSCTQPSGGSFLDHVRASPSNRNAVTFVISDWRLNSNERAIYSLNKPLSRELVNKTLMRSFGMIVRERRRYFRCPTLIPAILSLNTLEPLKCLVNNISEGGTALNVETTLPIGSRASLQFGLPGTVERQLINCEVCWHDEASRTLGARFVAQSSTQKAELQDWLARRLEQNLPPQVLDKFRAASIPQ